MGGAFIAISDDVNGIYTNPAGFCYGSGQEFDIYANKGRADSNGLGGAYRYTFGDISAVGVAILRGSLPSYDWRYGYIAYSRQIFENFSIGLNLKSEQLALPTKIGTGSSADLGVLYKVNGWFSLGCVVQNILSTSIKYDDGSPETEQSRYIEAGLAWMLIEKKMNLAIDLSRAGSSFCYRAGLEGVLTESITLRGGVSGSAEDVSTRALSAGLSYKINNSQGIDLAIEGSSTTASFSMLF